MPLFHFNLADHVTDADVEGTELRDAAEARIEAIVFAGAYLRDNPDMVWDGHEFRVEVTDDTGAPVFTVVVRTIDAQV
jgi:hypothetical protein